MVVMQALGGFEIHGSPQVIKPIARDRESAAVLAYLILARPGITYHLDSLADAFWPELGAGALDALDRVLTLLRRELPDGVIEPRGEHQVGVVPRHISCDVYDFEDAAVAGRWAEASALYRGPLLAGLDVPGAEGFRRWRDAERARLAWLAERARSRLQRAG